MRPVVQSTWEMATIRVVGPIDATRSSAGTKRMTAPRRARSSSSGPSSPGCSSVVVTTSSPNSHSRPAVTSPIPWLVEVVTATSSAGAPSLDAAASRARPRTSQNRSKAGAPIRGRLSAASAAAAIASAAARGSGPFVTAFRYAQPATAGRSARSSKRHHGVDGVVIREPKRQRSVQGQVAPLGKPARRRPLELGPANEQVVDADLGCILDPAPSDERAQPGGVHARVQVAAQDHRRSTGEPLEHEPRLLELRRGPARVGVDVPDRDLDAEPAVAQAHELSDARLAAEPALLVQLHAASR